MSELFFYRWDYYLSDKSEGIKTYALNQNSELIYDLEQGQHIWAFTRKNDKTYVLVLDLVVARTGMNKKSDPGYEYGKYNVVGDRLRSRYFVVEESPDVESLIRSLSFSPRAEPLGWSFRGRNAVRTLTPEDELKLARFSSSLPTI